MFALNPLALMLAADRPRRRLEILQAVPQDQADPAALDTALAALIGRDWIAAAEGCVVSAVPFEKPRRHRELDDWSSRWLGRTAPNN